MAGARRTIGDAYPDRFVLGVGVSHESTVTGRGHRYGRPVQAMHSYLEAMNSAPFDGHAPSPEPSVVVAALGPKMIGVAAELADGIHPFLTGPDHTATARELLGDGFIAVEQGVVLAADAEAARDAARANLARYLMWPNYRNHFLRSGFAEEDLADGGSDRLIDATFALGGVEAARRRVQDHLAAGANHVAIQVVDGGLDEAASFRELARALLD
jgi:probable F420-dependent oxidoreductase